MNKDGKTEDHALESVPHHLRHGWMKLSWNTAGIATTLVVLFLGALTSFTAGIKIAMVAGIFVASVGSLIGWACGHIAFKTGLSSTVMARHYGFGTRGSLIGSLIFGFMIIGFLALENALLYSGFRFAFGFHDTLINKLFVYGLLTLAWILITAYGFETVSRVSSYTLIAFIGLLIYITWKVVSKQADSHVFDFPALFPPEVLAGLGASNDLGKFIFCTNVLIGSAGALALVDADIGRFARSTSDIGVAAAVGNVALGVGMVFVGGVFMYAGMGELVTYYSTVMHMEPEMARKLAMSPDGVTAAFLLFGGGVGVVLMILAQSKAQVLNTYSGSLALSNLFDAVGLRTRRIVTVVIANVLGLVMVALGILDQVQAWLEILGVITTAFAGVMIVDYFVVSRMAGSNAVSQPELVNWAGVITTVIAATMAHYVLDRIVPIQFFTSLGMSFLLYPILRLAVFRPVFATDVGDPA
ncbi:purine-cytosine permease family protein [Cupriavidus sp. 8B]